VLIRRHELSDAEWELIQPLLPLPVLGRPRLDDRMVLSGIVCWRLLPPELGFGPGRPVGGG
jgi:transposase